MGEKEPFFARIYRLVAQIPEGKVATYGQLATLVGQPRAARTVGWAMQGAPRKLDLPCHRVVNAVGALSPAEVFGGVGVQRELLEREGVCFLENGCIDLGASLWDGPIAE